MKSIILLASLLLTSATAFAQSYPLTCVFDGEQDVVIYPAATPGKLIVKFTFKPSTQPATAGVPYGTCAWQDRGLYPDEPTVVAAIVPNSFKYTMGTVLTPSGALWAPQMKTRGYKVTFKVMASGADEGIPTSFFKVF